MRIGCSETRRFSDRTVGIGDDPTGTAYDVVVVVANPGLIPRHVTGRLYPPHELCRSQRIEHVVNGLTRHRRQHGTHNGEDGLGVRMRVTLNGLDNRYPRSGHAQRGST